jgi:hypothetical protein
MTQEGTSRALLPLSTAYWGNVPTSSSRTTMHESVQESAVALHSRCIQCGSFHEVAMTQEVGCD